MHHLRDADLRKEDPRLYNAAADYAINAIIFKLPKDFITLPEGCLFDAKFEGWSARQIYTYLKKECESEQPQDGEPCKDGDPGKGSKGGKVTDRRTGKSYATQPLDQHDFDGKEMTPEEVADAAEKIGDTLRKGALLAGMRGVTVPREVEDAQQGEIDWVAALREYVTEACKGRDEWSWKQYDVRRLADDLYAPSSESETVGEIVFAIDTSGSISTADLQKVAGELAHLVTEMPPSKVRVLWWNTAVHGEQCFDEGDYVNIAKMLKPQGGGGTAVSCVSKYLQDRAIQPEAVIVLTDGYVEGKVVWNVSCPTLWVLTSKGSGFEKRAPGGKVITVE
jgi:predicted metal-dependent peptidase